jgi:predicted DCC family thiol-disulfide oxidoreductase YuxK
MDTLGQNERMLLADIDTLRNQFPQTQDLYREVCVAMFFRYGMTPTANKLYQLVRKGSMSAPAEALNRFWENLREKSRVTVSHPDLPEALKDAAGELVAKLWVSAQSSAQETLESFKSEAQSQVAQADDLANLAIIARDQALTTLADLQEELVRARGESDGFRHEITALTSTKSAIESQLQDAKIELIASHARLDDARRELASELEKLRASAKLNEDRLSAAEKRALLEIDRERTLNSRLQKSLEAEQNENKHMAELHRTQTSELQLQIANLRHSVGVLEGAVKAANEGQEITNRELIDSRMQLSTITRETASILAERDLLLRQLKEQESLKTKQDTLIQPAARAKRRKIE